MITRKTETSEDLKPRPPEDPAFGLLCGARDLGPAIGPMMFAVDAAALAVLQALEALARAYAKRQAPKPKPGSGMPPPKGGRGRRRAKARWERSIALLGAEPRANPTATASPDDPSSAGNSRP